jgi:hypothetical protein
MLSPLSTYYFYLGRFTPMRSAAADFLADGDHLTQRALVPSFPPCAAEVAADAASSMAISRSLIICVFVQCCVRMCRTMCEPNGSFEISDVLLRDTSHPFLTLLYSSMSSALSSIRVGGRRSAILRDNVSKWQ